MIYNHVNFLNITEDKLSSLWLFDLAKIILINITGISKKN